jgi:hypothetical protein
MTKRSKWLCCLLLPLSMTSWAADAPDTESKVDPVAVARMVEMSNYLRSLPKFRVDTRVAQDVVLDSGQKIKALGTMQATVDGKTRMTVKLDTDKVNREYFYNGKQLTQYSPPLQYFTTVEVADNILDMLKQVENYYSLEIPLKRLYLLGNNPAEIDALTVAAYVGPSIVNGEVCDHLAFRRPGYDSQLWVSQTDKPLPCKLVITKTNEASQPEYSEEYRWNLKPKTKAGDFTFQPTKGDAEIPFKKSAE